MFLTRSFAAATSGRGRLKLIGIGRRASLTLQTRAAGVPPPETVEWSKDFVNSVHLIGNLGKDPLTKVTTTGKKVSSSTLAVTRKTQGESLTDWCGAAPLDSETEAFCYVPR